MNFIGRSNFLFATNSIELPIFRLTYLIGNSTEMDKLVKP